MSHHSASSSISNTSSQHPPQAPSSQPRLLCLFPVEGSASSQCPQETIASQHVSSQPPLLSLFPVGRVQQIRTDPFCGSMSVIGNRHQMQDAMTIVPDLCLTHMHSAEPCSMHFYGVFDGKWGNRISGFCQAHMHEMVRKELMTAPGHEIHAVPIMSSGWWQIIMERSFRNMDRLVLMTCPSGVLGVTCGTHCQHPNQMSFEGSTAAVVTLSKYQIVVANCGHSGVVLSHNGNPIPLTVPQKPDRPDERARIEALGGGQISWSIADNTTKAVRLLGITRAIGSRYLKRYLIPDPEVAVRTRDARDEFLIIASDGLWDAVSPTMACDVVRACLRNPCPPFYANEDDPYGQPHSTFGTSNPATLSVYRSPSATAAATLTSMAVAMGSGDNVSVIVIDLMNNRLGNPQSSVIHID